MKLKKIIIVAVGLMLLFILPIIAVTQGYRFGGEHLLILVTMIMIPTFRLK